MAHWYLSTHEWAAPQEATHHWRAGISTAGAEDIGEIVHVALPPIGTTVRQGEPFAEIESVKSIIDIHAPVSGTIASCNEDLLADPSLANNDPEGAGWFVVIATDDGSDPTSSLLDEAAYRQRRAGESSGSP